MVGLTQLLGYISKRNFYVLRNRDGFHQPIDVDAFVIVTFPISTNYVLREFLNPIRLIYI